MKKLTTPLLTIIISVSLLCVLSCNDAGISSPTPVSVSIRLNDLSGTTAYITDISPNNNFKKDPDLAAIAWKDSRNHKCVGRTLFKFNLTEVPTNATVTSAVLQLYYNPSPTHTGGVGHNTENGSNACFLEKVTQPWNDGTVTWSNKPLTNYWELFTLSESSSFDQNYSVDITSMVNDMVKNPSTNYGFLLRLQTELPKRSLNFQSIDANDSFRPLLDITYTVE
jgi:TGF-beta propeptide